MTRFYFKLTMPDGKTKKRYCLANEKLDAFIKIRSRYQEATKVELLGEK